MNPFISEKHHITHCNALELDPEEQDSGHLDSCEPGASDAFTTGHLGEALSLGPNGYHAVFERVLRNSYIGKELQQRFAFKEKT